MTVSPPPRVRFAPSPTGYLHIGGVRTVLFNWLWARKTGGTFILRIEDTDQERSTERSRQIIVDSLRWLGLDWDEGPEIGGPHGPYFQMQRLDLYRDFAERLIGQRKAYRCYCTKEELDAQRAALKAKDPKASFRYPGTCWDRKDEPDRPYVVRFRMPEAGTVTYEDRVFGTITTPNAAQQDFVIVRSDGVPLYNFGAVIDDMTMGITLVARGREHMVNTPPQLLLYNALGEKPPEFAHLPLMLAQNGEKLSKRHAAVSVDEYRALGYSPMGILNYLVRFGWSYGDEEIFSREDLIAKFDWANVGKADGKFDPKKFADVAFEHLKRPDLTSLPSYAAMVRPFLAEIGITHPDEDKLLRAIPTVRERGRTLREAAEAMAFFFRPPVFDEKAKAKFLTPDSSVRLSEIDALLSPLPAWDEAAIESAIQSWLASKGLAIKDIAQPARVALTGRPISPGLYEVLAVLGKDESLSRLRRGIELASGNASAAGGAPSSASPSSASPR
jgi:glutamyl-tRNA synthetase